MERHFHLHNSFLQTIAEACATCQATSQLQDIRFSKEIHKARAIQNSLPGRPRLDKAGKTDTALGCACFVCGTGVGDKCRECLSARSPQEVAALPSVAAVPASGQAVTLPPTCGPQHRGSSFRDEAKVTLGGGWLTRCPKLTLSHGTTCASRAKGAVWRQVQGPFVCRGFCRVTCKSQFPVSKATDLELSEGGLQVCLGGKGGGTHRYS